jgi:hypothetical protein
LFDDKWDDQYYQISAQELVANLKTHLVLNYEKMHLKRFFLIMKSDNESWNSDDIKKLSNHALKILTDSETRWPSSVDETDEKVDYLNAFIEYIEAENNDLFKNLKSKRKQM